MSCGSLVTPTAAKNPSASKMSSQPSPPISHSLPFSPSRSSTPGLPGRPSSSLPPLPCSDAPECKRTCCFSPVHPAPSSTQHSSFHDPQTTSSCGPGSALPAPLSFRGLRDKSAVHTPQLLLPSRHFARSSLLPNSHARLKRTSISSLVLSRSAPAPPTAPPSTMFVSSFRAFYQIRHNQLTLNRFSLGARFQSFSSCGRPGEFICQ